MKEELRPQIKMVGLEDRTVNHKSREKILIDPQVKTVEIDCPEMLVDENYSLPTLTFMEESLMSEVLDDLNVTSSKEKHFEEVEVKDISYVPMYEYCDKTSLVDISVQPPQLGIEDTETKPVMEITSQTDLFDQVRKIRQFTQAKYRK